MSRWIEKAASTSGKDGPVKMMALEKILAAKSEWEKKETEIVKLVDRGEIPLFLAGQSLNRSLVELMLFPALRNPQERDPRKRWLVPAYSGSRGGVLKDLGRSAGFDATALLTLAYLDRLEEAFDAFEEVYLPHSTLSWLFEERQKAVFHQPSRIRVAEEVAQMLASSVLNRFVGESTPESKLSDQIGKELAQLIAEAEAQGHEDDLQRLVVHPFPVHKIGSLITEEVDLTAHATVLVSCGSIIDRLRGHITAQATNRAKAYLRTREESWPNEPPIYDGAVLYMGNLTVSYLHHLKLLGVISKAGFKIVVSPDTVAEAEYLVRYSEISSETVEIIERIRSTLCERIASGRIKLGQSLDLHQRGDILEDRDYHHPTRCVFFLTRVCDSIISDDRFLNQSLHIDNESENASTYTTLDLVNALSIDEKPYRDWEYLTGLRRAGYLFIPVGEEELENYLLSSPVENGKVRETAELKAVRENLLCVRMRSMLQIPKEFPWFMDLMKTFHQVTKNLWKHEKDYSEIRARANWIVDQIDILGWAPCFEAEVGRDLVRTGQGPYLLLVLTPPIPTTQEVRREYWKWAEERILAPIKQQNPELFSWIVEFQRRTIAKVAAKDPFEEGTWDEQFS